jgi:hypothetical protein
MSRWLWSRLLEEGGWSRIWYGLATAMVIAGGGLIYHQVQDNPPPAEGTANLWIDSNGGTCTRSSSAVAYVDGTACSSMNAAYLAASAGDTVRAQTGTYSAQTIDYNAGKYTLGSRVIFEMAGFTAPTVASDGGAHIEVRNITLTGTTSVEIRADDGSSITAASHAGKDWVFDGGSMKNFLLRNAADITIRNMVIGDLDVFAAGADVPKVGAYNAVSGPELPSTNITITNNTFRNIWSSNQAASHPECFYFDGGIQTMVMSRNHFYGCGVMDLHGDPVGGAIGPINDVTIENNFFDWARDENGTTVGATINLKQAPNGYNNFIIRYNTILGNFVSETGATWTNPQIYGNVFVGHSGCADAISSSAWSNNMMDAVTCGSTDTVANAGIVSSSVADCTMGSCFQNNLHLSSTSSPAVDAGGATFPSVDFDGDSRPLGGGADLGADEKG